MIDLDYVSFENNGKLFPTYAQAYYNGRNCGNCRVYYYFTLTGQKFKRVCELENAFRKYCQLRTGFDYFDFKNNLGVKQLNLIGEV